jgi:hypothetical protein
VAEIEVAKLRGIEVVDGIEVKCPGEEAELSKTCPHCLLMLSAPQDERRALRELWQAKGRNTNKKTDAMEKNLHSSDATQFWGAPEQERLSTADVIVIEPQVQQESPEYFSCQHSTISDEIEITTQSFNSFAEGRQKQSDSQHQPAAVAPETPTLTKLNQVERLMQGNTNADDINRGAETIEHQSSDGQQEVAGQQGGASETYTDPNSHAPGEMNTARSFSPQ